MAHAIENELRMPAMMMQDTVARADTPANMESARVALEIVPVWMNTIMQVVHHLPGDRTRPYIIGEDPGASFSVCADLLGGREAWSLVDPDGTVRIPATADEVHLVRADGSTLEAGSIPGACNLSLGDRLRVRVGSVVFVIRAVRAARKLRLPVSFDWDVLSFTGASMALNAIVLAIAFFFPQNTVVLSHDVDFMKSRFGRLLDEPVELRVEELPDWMQKSEPTEKAEGGDGERHAGDEGQMGDVNAKKSDRMYGIKGNADPSDRQLARLNKDQVAKTGILSAMSQTLDMPTSPFGGKEAIGSDHESALGALIGSSVGPNFGFGGMGMIGSGDGGGGTGEGTLGLGKGVWTKIGHGGGGGPDGVGYCPGGDCGGGLKKKPGTKVPNKVEISGQGQVIGCLSKESIRRVIRQHINEVKHCYDKGLMSKPDLEGRISVKFTITANGSVGNAKVTESSLGDTKVGQCVADAVERWVFEPLQGCGVVVVSYPFNFVPASDS